LRLNICLWTSRTTTSRSLLFVCLVLAHFFLYHKSVELDAWQFHTSTVVGIVNTLILELFLSLKAILLLIHDLLCSEDRSICREISFFDQFNSFLVFAL